MKMMRKHGLLVLLLTTVVGLCAYAGYQADGFDSGVGAAAFQNDSGANDLLASKAGGETTTEAVKADGPAAFGVMQFLVLVLGGLGAGVIALVTAFMLYKSVLKADPGNDRMVEIAGHVKDGAMAYLKRQRNIVLPVLGIVGLLIAFGANYALYDADNGITWMIIILLGFITGGLASFLTGWFGMVTATSASSRTAQACSEKEDGLNKGLQVAFKAGSVMGLSVVGLGLVFVTLWLAGLAAFTNNGTLIAATMVNFGMGASMVALFARVGGGIYTKAADVGADLVGKVEAGIPEDDPRNPATIADNVGDNVGDVAGMGADLYESYGGSILAAMALAAAAASEVGGDSDTIWKFMAAPIGLAACGIIFAIFGRTLVKTKEGATLKDLLHSLHKGVNVASLLMIPAAFAISWFCFAMVEEGQEPIAQWWGIAVAMVIGLASGLIIGMGSERYTAYDFKPTQGVAKASRTGPATVIIEGLAVGMMSTWIPIMVVAVATALAFGFSGGFKDPSLGLYGIAVAAVGMLSTLGITLATDAYGPIADNAGGNAEMAGLDPSVREKTDALDSLGNTTAAIGKGFAIGSAALTALALIATFWTMAKDRGSDMNAIALTDPMVISGLFIGALLVFVFAAMTMTAVGKAALDMVEEVRRQFKEKPGIMEGTDTPDYARCVDISTTGALREMIVPSVMAVIAPVLVGIFFGVGGVIGMLGGALATGFGFAIFMANAGGAWDNAKKWVEKGEMEIDGVVKGKGTDEHKATVVGDTVGDPFKDTSGPALNILIKLLSMVSVATIGITFLVNDGQGVFQLLTDLFDK